MGSPSAAGLRWLKQMNILYEYIDIFFLLKHNIAWEEVNWEVSVMKKLKGLGVFYVEI